MTTIPTWPESVPYWDATRHGQLVVQWCQACRQPIHFPRVACPRCLSGELEFRPSAGRGTVYACTVVHTRGPSRVRDRGPYVVALVDLDEGVRMMTNVFGCPPEAVHVGMRVRVMFEDVGDPEGRRLPVFEPEETT